MTTRIKYSNNGKVIIKEDKRNIFACLMSIIKWRDQTKNIDYANQA